MFVPFGPQIAELHLFFCAFFSPFTIFCEYFSPFVLKPGTNILIHFQAEAAAQFLNVMGSYMESLCSDLSSHTITNVQSNNDRVSQSTIKILLSSRFLVFTNFLTYEFLVDFSGFFTS